MKNNFLGWLISVFFPQQCIECKTIQKTSICISCIRQVIKSASCQNIIQKIPVTYYFSYETLIKEILHQIKFKKSRELAILFADQIATLPLPNRVDQNSLIIPIPSHPKRVKERGFNHVNLLFEQWAKYHHLTLIPILRRKTNTQSLFNLTKKQRECELKNVFELSHYDCIQGKKIILIDDITTSGSTLAEAAQLLTAHGASQVMAITLAFTPLESP